MRISTIWIALLLLGNSLPAAAGSSLLNASYDVSREFYKQYNPLFAQHWKKQTGEELTINMSHGGSSKQARAIADGLEADVATMNQSIDIDVLAERQLIPSKWAERLPNHSAPFSSTMLLLVRKGNPKGIKSWEDLIKPGISVIIPNPKTSGNGRYTYLAAWGSVIKQGGKESQARDFVGKLFKNVPILDAGGRAATTTFVQRGIGDVLVTFENEVQLIKQEYGADQFDIVYPATSIVAELPVTVVDRYADKHGTRKQAEGYLSYLYSPQAQDLAAQHELRPHNADILAKYRNTLPPLKLFTVEEVFGSLKQAQAVHFKDGGTFDQIYQVK